MEQFSRHRRSGGESLSDVSAPAVATRDSPVQKLIDGALGELSRALAEGKSENLQNLLRVLGRFHHYSFYNALLIATHRPEATRVLGFNRWKELGRHVRKGERGIPVIAPIVRRARDADREANPPEATGSAPREIRGFRAVYVFDISQTDGEPLPEGTRHAGDPGEHLGRLKEVVSSFGVALSYIDLPPGHAGRSKGREIEIARGLPPAEEFVTLAHELAHELLHQKEGEVRPPKAVRETEAEAVAFAVASAVGLDSTRAATDYIQLYDGDPEVLTRSLGRIRATAAEILARLTGRVSGPAARPEEPNPWAGE